MTIVTQSLFPGFEQIFGSKIQDFFPDFFQNNNFFFQTLSYQNRWAIETLKKEQEQSFINDALQTYRWDWTWFHQQEKNISLVKHFL